MLFFHAHTVYSYLEQGDDTRKYSNLVHLSIVGFLFDLPMRDLTEIEGHTKKSTLFKAFIIVVQAVLLDAPIFVFNSLIPVMLVWPNSRSIRDPFDFHSKMMNVLFSVVGMSVFEFATKVKDARPENHVWELVKSLKFFVVLMSGTLFLDA